MILKIYLQDPVDILAEVTVIGIGKLLNLPCDIFVQCNADFGF